MKVSDGLTILLVGIFIVAVKANEFDGDDEDFHNEDYNFRTEHDHNGHEKSQSISHGGYDDDGDHDGVDESHYEKYETDSTLNNPITLKKVRSIDENPPLVRSILYVSPEEIGLSSARYRRSPKKGAELKPGDEGHTYDNTYAKFLAENFPSRDEEGNKDEGENSDKKSSQYRNNDNQDDVEVYHAAPKYPSDDYERIKYLSNQQAEELKKNPANCKIVVKGEMECHICNDEKTGANSESCSYSSTPDHNKYAYHREKSYDSKKDKKPSNKKKNNQKIQDVEVVESGEIDEKDQRLTATAAPQRTSRGRGGYNRRGSSPRSESYRAEESRPPREAIGLDPFLYGSRAEYKSDVEIPKNYESYFSHVFPAERSQRLKSEANEDDGNKEYEIIPEYSPKSDVDSVLAEFATKDWSKCKKTAKGDSTCYECKDKDGIKFEECMYVSESTPKNSRLVYDQKKSRNNGDSEPYGSEQVHVIGELSTPATTTTTGTPSPSKTKRIVIKKRRTTKNLKNNGGETSKAVGVDLTPENQKENDDPKKEKRTYKRTVSYKIQSAKDGENNPKGSRSIHYEHSFIHSN